MTYALRRRPKELKLIVDTQRIFAVIRTQQRSPLGVVAQHHDLTLARRELLQRPHQIDVMGRRVDSFVAHSIRREDFATSLLPAVGMQIDHDPLGSHAVVSRVAEDACANGEGTLARGFHEGLPSRCLFIPTQRRKGLQKVG